MFFPSRPIGQFAVGALLVLGLATGQKGHAQETRLRVNVFPVSSNLSM
ncbi:MAG: hypothetical protein HYZ46_02225, partial [Nitrosomonadales bacterium]|nr:hypothetical protein [Nitrosomonadales bacterium]